MHKNLRPFLAELIGSFAFVLISAGAVCTSQLAYGSGPPQAHLLTIALATGLMLMVWLPVTLEVAGGFLNPAVTLTLWVFKRLEGGRACWLIAAQLLGGFAAGLCLRWMFADGVLNEAHFGTPHLNMPAFGGTATGEPTVPILLSGIGIEFVLTFLIALVIYAAILDPRAPQLGVFGPGLTLIALTLMAYPLTGVAVNPARWLGPALWELTINRQAFRDHAVYWIGPIFGALAAGAVYEYLFWPADDAGTTTETSGGGTAPVTSTLFKKKG
jgi:MIP family channel proteins